MSVILVGCPPKMISNPPEFISILGPYDIQPGSFIFYREIDLSVVLKTGLVISIENILLNRPCHCSFLSQEGNVEFIEDIWNTTFAVLKR